MARIDHNTRYNPFGWRLAERDDPTTTQQRRQVLDEELLLCEAHELAHGYRHLTIRHGDPIDLAASRHLSAFYDTLADFDAEHPGIRVRGTSHYVTVTIVGDHADNDLIELADAAHSVNSGDWLIVASAIPPGI